MLHFKSLSRDEEEMSLLSAAEHPIVDLKVKCDQRKQQRGSRNMYFQDLFSYFLCFDFLTLTLSKPKKINQHHANLIEQKTPSQRLARNPHFQICLARDCSSLLQAASLPSEIWEGLLSTLKYCK